MHLSSTWRRDCHVVSVWIEPSLPPIPEATTFEKSWSKKQEGAHGVSEFRHSERPNGFGKIYPGSHREGFQALRKGGAFEAWLTTC